MRRIMAFLSLGWLAVAGMAQGQVDFRNDSGVIGAVFDIDRTTKLSAPWRAQLYAGPDGTALSALKPVGAPAPFGVGARAGYWDPSPDPIRMVPGVAPGEFAALVVKVWVPAVGCESFECTADIGGSVLVSRILNLRLGGDGLPPATLLNITWIPEPPPVTLALLALGVWGSLGWCRSRHRR